MSEDSPIKIWYTKEVDVIPEFYEYRPDAGPYNPTEPLPFHPQVRRYPTMLVSLGFEECMRGVVAETVKKLSAGSDFVAVLCVQDGEKVCSLSAYLE